MRPALLRTPAAWVGLCVGLLLAWTIAAAAAGPGSEDGDATTHVVKAARFLLADDETPPADDRAWTAVTLPDNWSVSRRQAQGLAWYRMTLDLGPAQPGRTALLVPRLSMNGEFFVNGVRVLSGGRMADPVARRWNTPFYVEVPAPLLHAGANTLDIRIYAYRNNNGGLGSVYWGDVGVLQARHALLYAVHVKGAVMSFAVAVVSAFIGIVAWLRMQRSTTYGLFGLAMLAWAVRYANYFIEEAPFDTLLYSVVVNSAQGWFFVFFTPFLLRLSRIRLRWLELVLYTMGVLGTAGIYAAYSGWLALGVVVGLWMCVWVPGALVLLAVSLRNALRQRTPLTVLAALVAWLYVPLTVRELLITSGVMPFDGSYVAHYVGMLLALLVASMLIDRVVAAGQAASLAELAQAQAAFEERQRITQDMHDGLGLQLNAALRVVERGEIDRDKVMALLRASLDELRLIVDSSATASGEFLPLLATLRQRLQRRLEAIGIEIRWQMEDFPQDLVLPSNTSLQVMRIVQEVINNVIKHAEASEIVFNVVPGQPPDRVVLEVRDNGVGYDTGGQHPGRGLGGMRRRATAAGVTLDITSGPGGTAVRIGLPVRTASPSPPALPS